VTIKRFRADMLFNDADPRNDIVEEARRRMAASIVVNEGTSSEERSYFSVEDCGHDETPPTGCVTTERWEAGRGRVI